MPLRSHSRLRLIGLGLVLLASAGAAVAALQAWPAVVAALAAHDLTLAAPAWLWLLAALPYVFAVPIFSLADLPLGQRIASALVRAALLVAAAVALADPQEIRREPLPVRLVVLADLSPSVSDAFIARAQDVVSRLSAARGEAALQVVGFAKGAALLPAGPRGAAPRLVRPPAEAVPETDIQSAIRLAYGLYAPGELKRLLILSDGRETTGSAAAEAEVAARFGVAVSHGDLSALTAPGEFMVRALNLPPEVQARVPFEVAGELFSNTSGGVTCRLTVADAEPIAAEPVELRPGSNPVRFSVRVKEGGDKAAELACAPGTAADVPGAVPAPAPSPAPEAPAAAASPAAPDPGVPAPAADRVAANNRFAATLRVADRPRLLYVEGERAYRGNLLAALQEDFEVEVRGAGGVPTSAAELERFDLLILSDVPRQAGGYGENVTTAQMKLLDRFVQAGGGLIVTGGAQSLGPGGYTDSYLEREVLPVWLEVEKREEETDLALMLVIDRSGSMTGQKLQLAKEAAKATGEVLGKNDRIGVVVFDALATRLVRLQSARNRLRLVDNLERLRAGGGTNILPALELAHEDLRESGARVRHVILLSDGQSPKDGIEERVATMAAEGITISTVGVGATADRTLLASIAEGGGGRFYFTDRPDTIPRIFMKETSEVTREAVVEDRFQVVPERRFSNAQVFRGIDFRRAPPLLGYVATRAKPAADVLLRTHLGEPLLVRWRRGLGQVVVWTSDVKNRWSHFWLGWGAYAQFWRQLVRDTQRVERDTVYPLFAEVRRGELHVWADAVGDDDRFRETLTGSVTVRDPNGERRALPLEQTAVGRYEARLPLVRFGPYALDAVFHDPAAPEGADAAPAATGRTAVAYPYPEEHLQLGHDLTALRALAAATGGEVDPSPASLFDPGPERRERRESLRVPWLWLAVGLFALDVLLRRLRLWPAPELPLGPAR